MKKKFFLVAFLAAFFTLTSYSASADEVTANHVQPVATLNLNLEASPAESTNEYANITEWKYKTENGKSYRRLWDATARKWLTDWLLIA